MKVPQIASITPSPLVQASTQPPKISFRDILDRVKSLDIKPGLDKVALEKNTPAQFQAMIQTQIRVHEWGVRVELASKVADGLVSTTKRLQGGQ